MRTSLILAVVSLWVSSLSPSLALAQTGANVAVVINDASAASQQIGEYYVRKRNVPAENVIHIRVAPADEISAAVFASAIEGPIAGALTRGDLQDRILYILLTKDVPLRIKGSSGANGTIASVDSELTLLYRRLTGVAIVSNGPIPNPYFLNAAAIAEAKPFTHAKYDIYLVTRLDAFTADEAMHLVDKAMAPVAGGRVVLDEKATLFNRTGEDWLEAAAKRLTDMGHGDDVRLDREASPVRDVRDVLGYYSWGSNDPANRTRNFGMQFVPGALAAMFVSSDARTFNEPPADWQPTGDWNDKKTWFAGSPQSLSGDLIREGVTGVAGHVAEPLLGATIRPEILFPAYFAGRNLAESFYLAMPYLSWQTVVIGDPLCRPFASKPVVSADLVPAITPETGLPGFFSGRAVAVAKVHYRLATDEQATLAVRAHAHLAKGDRARAKEAYRDLVRLAPASVTAQLEYADFLNADQEWDGAIEHYRAALKLQANNAIALNNLAYVLATEKRQIAEAKDLADQALRLAPREPTIADTAGWIAYLSGDYPRASTLLAQAAARSPQNPEIHLHAAFAYEASGAKAAARSELETALKLNPKLASRDDVKALRTKLGQTQ